MSLLTDFLFGLYIGLLTGIIPALVSGVLGFVFKYFTGVTIPGLGVVVLAVAIAGVNGGLLGLMDPTIVNSPSLLVGLVVVMMLSLYAHNQGDKLGAAFPRRFSLRSLRQQTLSADVVRVVGGIGHVTITVEGEVDDIEGYPALPAELRAELSAGRWEFPADVPIAELERRLEDRLRTDHGLAEVDAAVGADGTARIAAAPPMGGLSQRVPDGYRAVSVAALVPTGIARGERVWIETDDDRYEGTIVSARSGEASPPPGAPDVATDGGQPEDLPTAPTVPTTTGGEGRVTVALPRARATELLAEERARVIVRSRGTRREFELLALLRRSGKQIGRLTVREGGLLDGATVGSPELRQTHDVSVFAVRGQRDGSGVRSWSFSPDQGLVLAPGDEVFVAGRTGAIQSLDEVSA